MEKHIIDGTPVLFDCPPLTFGESTGDAEQEFRNRQPQSTSSDNKARLYSKWHAISDLINLGRKKKKTSGSTSEAAGALDALKNR